MPRLTLFLLPFLLTALSAPARAQRDTVPFTVADLFDLEQANTLGLTMAAAAETFTVFRPLADQPAYNHGVVLFPFQGQLYAQWQSSSRDEDAEDTQVFYSRSADGATWSAPAPLTARWTGGIKTSGGWWSDGKTLVAYLCVWPTPDGGPKQGHTVYRSSTDGLHWTDEQPVTDPAGHPVPGIIEQDVHALPGGRLLTAFHLQPGLQVTPYYTDDPTGVSGWIAGDMQNMVSSDSTMSRAIEPSWFYRRDGAAVMVFRDQQGSFKKLAAVSHDDGVSWSTPVIVDTPDSRAKQSAGNLPDGTAFLVSNPTGSKRRFPLAIALSRDGLVFDSAYLVRSGGADLQGQRFPGKYKRPGYSYPKSVVWGEYLYVAYATNKEDVEITRIPWRSLVD